MSSFISIHIYMQRQAKRNTTFLVVTLSFTTSISFCLSLYSSLCFSQHRALVRPVKINTTCIYIYICIYFIFSDADSRMKSSRTNNSYSMHNNTPDMVPQYPNSTYSSGVTAGSATPTNAYGYNQAMPNAWGAYSQQNVSCLLRRYQVDFFESGLDRNLQ